MRKLSPNEKPILPIGKVNFKTGQNNILGNVRDCWSGGTFEIYECEIDTSTHGKRNIKTVYKAVCTAGNALNKIGDEIVFAHDQNHKFLFRGIMVDSIKVDQLSSKYGTSLQCYCYK